MGTSRGRGRARFEQVADGRSSMAWAYLIYKYGLVESGWKENFHHFKSSLGSSLFSVLRKELAHAVTFSWLATPFGRSGRGPGMTPFWRVES